MQLLPCSGCGEDLPTSVFHKMSGKGKGYQYRCKECQKWSARERLYGINREQFYKLLASQDYKCALCRGEEKDWHVDHCHDSGAVRGILCSSCNLALGRLGDSLEAIQRVLRYLTK